MSGNRTIVVSKDADVLAAAVAARLVTRLVDAQAPAARPRSCSPAAASASPSLRASRATPARDAVDWRRVDIWWGDERFAAGRRPRAQREAGPRRAAGRRRPRPARVHPIPALGRAGRRRRRCGRRRVRRRAGRGGPPEDHDRCRAFDVLLLGVGAEGHVASIFPESPAAHDERAGRRRARLPEAAADPDLADASRAINAAREVWLVAGRRRRRPAAVALALGGAGAIQVPAAGVHGRAQTLWLLDRESAAKLPLACSASDRLTA